MFDLDISLFCVEHVLYYIVMSHSDCSHVSVEHVHYYIIMIHSDCSHVSIEFQCNHTHISSSHASYCFESTVFIEN